MYTGYKPSYFFILKLVIVMIWKRLMVYTRMNKTVFIVIDLTPDFNFFLQKLDPRPPYKPTPLNFNNSFTQNFSVYTRSYTVYKNFQLTAFCIIGRHAGLGVQGRWNSTMWQDWLLRLDDDGVATNLPLQLMLHVERQSCSICTMSYDTQLNRNVIYTLAARPRMTGSAVLDNRMLRSFSEVATRSAFNRRL